ncbi:MAG: glycosyltransferase family 4 protein [Rickettsia endosymbiont of Bryobia graminum]|nr:glycosyltransferase family 4 protein [Rickettsia endosymbiont of Bryobia graminum]
MNILYLDHYAGSTQYGRSFRPYYLGTEWIKKNHKVFVVGGSFSHLRNKQPDSSIEDIDGIKYIWLNTPKYKGNGIKRAYSVLIFMLQLFLNLRKIIKITNPDVIIASSVHMLDIYPAWLMKRLLKKKTILVFELHDLWPQTLIEISNISKFNPFVMLLSVTEKFVYKTVDKIISILPNSLSYMSRFGIKSNQFCYVPNGVVLSEWNVINPLPETQQKIINELKEKNKFLIGYAGAYTIANGLYNLLGTAYLCQQRGIKDIHFVLIGKGLEKENIIRFVQDRAMTNISFLDAITKQHVPSFLQQMDALYGGFVDKPIYQYGISPNKIFDYMMSSRPILYAISRGSDIVEKAKCGITVPSDSPELLYEAILKLKDYPKATLDQMGFKGKNYVIQHHNYQHLASRFIDCIVDH